MKIKMLFSVCFCVLFLVNGCTGQDVLFSSQSSQISEVPRSFVINGEAHLKDIKHHDTRTRGLGKGSKKKNKKDKNLVCKNTENENDVTASLFITPRNKVDDFIDTEGNAIKEVENFVKLIRDALDIFEKNHTDRELLISAMAPNEDLEEIVESFGVVERHLNVEECVVAVRCAALFADVIAKGFDLSFSLVGLGGLSGAIGATAGKAIAKRILASPKGSRVLNDIASLASKNSNPNPAQMAKVVSEVVSTVVNEVGVNNIMRAVADSADLSYWQYVQIAASFAANIAAIFASSGAVLAWKITQAGVNAVGLFEAVKALDRCKEECTDAPTTAPTKSPIKMPTPPPVNPPTTPPGRRSGVFGDPHLSTFDALRFDCQAAGEFITVTSLETPEFMIQERFTSVGSNLCSQASVSTGVVIKDKNVPKVQISTPRNNTNSTSHSSLNTIASCPIDFYVDGIANDLSDDNIGTSSIDVFRSGSRIRVSHTASFVSIDVRIQKTASFGCHFLVQVFIPFDYRPGETILGLLGTPDGNRRDDWRARNGTILGTPDTVQDSIFAPSYQYCVNNWCIQNSTESLFTYTSDESFSSIYACDKNYTDDIESAVSNPSEELSEICGANVFCLVDGFCGDLNDAANALRDEQIVENEQEAGAPSPSSAPSSIPTFGPSFKPSMEPSEKPSFLPSKDPSSIPSDLPSVKPSTSQSPSSYPSSKPTLSPSVTPSLGKGKGKGKNKGKGE